MEYYGVDIHKRYSVFACVDAQGNVLRRGRVPNRTRGNPGGLGVGLECPRQRPAVSVG
jgi:hypothetical protein